MGTYAKVSSAVSFMLGPFLDASDGKTPLTSLTPALKISRHGGAFVTGPNGSHVSDGFYDFNIGVSDFTIVGRYVLQSINSAVHLPVWHEVTVVHANIYDSLFNADGQDLLDVQAAAFDANVITSAAIANGALESIKFNNDTGLESLDSGQAQAGAASTITLQAGASSVTDFYKDCIVVTTGGSGQLQHRLITGYDGGTKIATITPNWATNPGFGTSYAVRPSLASAPGGSGPTAAQIADAVWDELQADHVAAGSFGVVADEVGQLLETGILYRAQAVSADATQIEFPASASSVSNIFIGTAVVLIGGTGAGQIRICTGYNGTTKIAIFSYNWVVAPDSTTVFAVIGSGAANVNSWRHATPNVLTSSRIDVSVGAMASSVLNAAAIASNAIQVGKIQDNAFSAAKFATDAIDKISDGVWDEDIVAAHGGPDSAGLINRGSTGYQDRTIYHDQVVGTSGTTAYVNGTIRTPVKNLSEAITLGAALAIRRVRFNGTFINPAVVPASASDYALVSAQQSVLVFASNTGLAVQSLSGASVTGSIGAGTYLDCSFPFGVTTIGSSLFRCSFEFATILLTDGNSSIFDVCRFGAQGGPTTMNFNTASAAQNTILVRSAHGALKLTNMGFGGATDVCFVSGSALTLTVDASCVGGTLTIAGQVELIDESAGTTIIQSGVHGNQPIATKTWNETVPGAFASGSAGHKLGNLSSGAGASAALNVAANAFVPTTVVETGTFANTAARDAVLHQLDDIGNVIDGYYEFQVGADGAPVNVNAFANLQSANDTIEVFYFAWGPTSWVQIGTIPGSGSTSLNEFTFDIIDSIAAVGQGTDQGKVRIRFATAAGASNPTLQFDSLALGYTIIPPRVLFSGLAQAGGASTITFPSSASTINDFYKPAIVQTITGTGAGQSRRIDGYNGSTFVATVSTPWATQPDSTTSFIVLPWASVRVTDSGYEDGAVWVNTVTGVAGTVVGINGTSGNPVSLIGDAKILAAALGLRKIRVHAPTLSEITLLSSFSDYVIEGTSRRTSHMFGAQQLGSGRNLTIVESAPGQSVFEDCNIERAMRPSSNMVYRRCHFSSLSEDARFAGGTLHHFLECHFTASDFGTFGYDFRLTGTLVNVLMRGCTGLVRFKNMGQSAVDNVEIYGDMTVILDSSCIGSTLTIAGNVNLINNSTGAGVTVTDNGALSLNTIRDKILPKKNRAFSDISFLMVNASDVPLTGLTVTVERSIDGGAFVSASGSVSEVGNGIYQFDASATDLNGTVCTFRFSSAGAKDTFLTVVTGG